jgi:prepilin-type N-terminal cleavage/methylation domain-containing protein
MSMRSRSGFTLIELMISLLLFVLVGGAIYKVLNVSQRAARTQTERASMQGGLRTGVQVAISELQELWTDPGGTSAITLMTPTKITYYGMRGSGVTCGTPGATQIKVLRSTYTDSRGGIPTTGNAGRVWVFEDKQEDRSDDDTWEVQTISSVGSGVCDDGVSAAIVLTVPGLTTPAGARDPAPIRTDELMELGLVTVDGRDWLGIGRAGTGEDLTPLAGPLETGGLEFLYRDANNSNTGSVSAVKSILMTLRAESDRAANAGISSQIQLLTESERVRIQLRNSR